MKRFILLISLTLSLSISIAQTKILFDNTKSETAGNADWVIDDNQPIPSPAQSGITSSTLESYWLGGISSWGVEMVKQGFCVETLPTTGRITYGDGTNAQDLSNYKVFVVCEPNNLFTASEKTAMMNFVYNGGGLFIVADHAVADRDGDGYDALQIWNDFMTNNPVKNNPFGFTFDAGSNISAVPTLNVSSLATDPILHGPKGNVEGIDFHNGSTMTINTTDNPSVKAAVYQTGYSNTGTTGVMVAYATYGSGRVVAVGDSSVPEDETAQSGTTYPGWTEPVGGVADGDNGVLMTNGTIWLGQSSAIIAEPTNNATSFTATEPTSSTIKLTWIDAIGAVLPSSYLIKWSTSAAAIINPVDGTPEANGVNAKNISQGTQTATIDGLTANTTYYFKIFPYTNSGSNINYLVSSTPSTSYTTLDGATIINSENFASCPSLTWKYYDVSGDDAWICGSGYSEINGYGGTVDEDWLISPALNLNLYSGEILSFKTATQYTGPAIELLYSTNYDGTSNPSTQGTWSSLSCTLATTTTFTSSGNVSLASLSGTAVYIAFKYKATGTTSGTAALWQVDDILIEGYPYSAPANQASNLSFAAVGENSMTINWTNGNGSKRIVKMNTSNSFTNPLDGTDPAANTVYIGGEQVIYNGSGNSVSVTGLAPNTTYWFRVYEFNYSGSSTKYNVTTAAGNPNSQSTSLATPPTVSIFSPVDNAIDVAPTENLVLTFSENVKQGTAGSITIYNSTGIVFETIPYNDSRVSYLNNLVTINPAGTFNSSANYYVYIDATAIQDFAGNAYSGISSSTAWNFTVKDVVPPTVLSYSPADNSTSVGVNDNLILSFSENVRQGTAGSITVYNSTGTVFETIPYSDSRISYLNNSVTINPAGTFNSGASYYVYIDATAIQDVAGNSYAGINNSATWNFTTQPPIDVTPPAVISFSPSDNATNVNTADNLVLTFSENVKQGTAGNITIIDNDATTFESIPYNDSRVSYLNNTVTINPTKSFAYSTSYYVYIDSRSIRDIAGNYFSGISNNSIWNFTTLTSNSVTSLSDGEFLIYPNPTKDFFTIILPNDVKRMTVDIIDTNGQIKKQINNLSGKITIDVSGYAKGVYIIKMNLDGKSSNHRLIIK